MFINKSINYTINQDIYNLIYSLNHLYNINQLEYLLKRYSPNINFNENKNNNYNKNKKKYRCIARCWGGKISVKYNPITKKWTYGTQCKKYTIDSSQFCKIHYKQTLRTYGLTHGTIYSNPPHPHYNKYKIHIQKKFNII
jgi:hypothetical protein